MSAWAKPGVKCVLVEDNWPAGSFYGTEVLPVVGTAYTVRELVQIQGFLLCRLVEIRNPTLDYRQGFMECAFDVGRFRPLVVRTQEQDVALFTPYLAPVVPA